jgi:hypothetical protein
MTTNGSGYLLWLRYVPYIRSVIRGAPIELYSGPIAVDSIGPWEGRIFADLAGDLQVRWSGTRADGWLNTTDVINHGINVSAKRAPHYAYPRAQGMLSTWCAAPRVVAEFATCARFPPPRHSTITKCTR